MAFGFQSFDVFAKQFLVEFGRFKSMTTSTLLETNGWAGKRSFPFGAKGLSSERLLLVLGECI